MLTDVIQSESGTSLHRLVSAPLARPGTDTPALSALTEKPGTLTPTPANAQSPQPGTESSVSHVLEAESTI